jgi:hypothetical protein
LRTRLANDLYDPHNKARLEMHSLLQIISKLTWGAIFLGMVIVAELLNFLNS